MLIKIYTLNTRVQAGLERATRMSVSFEALDSIWRSLTAVMECLDQTSGDESSILPAFASLSCTDTPPSSPIHLSPSTSPRLPRTIRPSVSFDMSTDSSDRYLPPLTARPQLQPFQSAYPLSQSNHRKSSYSGVLSATNDLLPSEPYLHFSSPLPATPSNSFSQQTASFPRPTISFVPHSFDQPALTSPHPIHSPSQSNVPRTAMVFTQPVAIIREVQGIKRRGRPSTRIDNRCVDCGTHNTPEWRRGEGGVHLCNACGLQYSKRVRRERAEKKRNSIAAVLNVDM